MIRCCFTPAAPSDCFYFAHCWPYQLFTACYGLCGFRTFTMIANDAAFATPFAEIQDISLPADMRCQKFTPCQHANACSFDLRAAARRFSPTSRINTFDERARSKCRYTQIRIRFSSRRNFRQQRHYSFFKIFMLSSRPDINMRHTLFARPSMALIFFLRRARLLI